MGNVIARIRGISSSKVLAGTETRVGLDDSELLAIAKQLSPEDWIQVALQLGFTIPDIERYKFDNKDSILTAMVCLFKDWVQDQSTTEDCITKLAEALRETGLVSISENLLAQKLNITDFDIGKCRKELERSYSKWLLKIPQYPGDINGLPVNQIFMPLEIHRNQDEDQCLQQSIPSHHEIFTTKDDESHKRILITSRKGCGMSTLVSKLAHEWSTRDEISPLKDIPLLFILDLSKMERMTLEEAIVDQLLPNDTLTSCEQLRGFINTHQSDIAIFLCGYNQYNQHHLSHDIANLISHDILQEALVMVTTYIWTPFDFDTIRSYKSFEVCGFSEDIVLKYIEQRFDWLRQNEKQTLIHFLKVHDMLPGIASHPVMISLLCRFWKSMNGDWQSEVTSQLYSELFNYMHKCARSGNLLKYAKLMLFPWKSKRTQMAKLSEVISNVGRLAFEGLWLKEQVQREFTSEELAEELQAPVLAEALQMGLMCSGTLIKNTGAVVLPKTHASESNNKPPSLRPQRRRLLTDPPLKLDQNLKEPIASVTYNVKPVVSGAGNEDSIASAAIEPIVSAAGIIDPVVSGDVEPIVAASANIEPIVSSTVDPIVSAAVETIVSDAGNVEFTVFDAGNVVPIVSAAIEPIVSADVNIESIVSAAGNIEPIAYAAAEPIASAAVEPIVSAAHNIEPIVSDAGNVEYVAPAADNVEFTVSAAVEPIVSAAVEPIVSAAVEPIVSAALEPIVSAAVEPIVSAAVEPIVSAAVETILSAAVGHPMSAAVEPTLSAAGDVEEPIESAAGNIELIVHVTDDIEPTVSTSSNAKTAECEATICDDKSRQSVSARNQFTHRHKRNESSGSLLEMISNELSEALEYIGTTALGSHETVTVQKKHRRVQSDQAAYIKLDDTAPENLHRTDSAEEIFVSLKHPCTFTFFHESAQDKCAADYLAQQNLDWVISILHQLKSIDDALKHAKLLRFACGANPDVAGIIIQRLTEIHIQELPHTLQSGYYEKVADINEWTHIQRYIELCLGCNFESASGGQFKSHLTHLFPAGQVNFLGMSPAAVIYLGYFLSSLDSNANLTSIQITPIPRRGDYCLPKKGPVLKLYNELGKGVAAYNDLENLPVYTQVYGHSDVAGMCYTELCKTLENQPSNGESDLLCVFQGLVGTTLKVLDLSDIPLHDQIRHLLSIIKQGHLSSLEDLRLHRTNLNDHHIAQLTILRHTKKLKALDISANKAGNGLPSLIEGLLGISLRNLNIAEMNASASAMAIVLNLITEFPKQLAELQIHGNGMDKKSATILRKILPKLTELNVLTVSMSSQIDPLQRHTILSIVYLQHLQILSLHHLLYSTTALSQMSIILDNLLELHTLFLDADEEEKISPECIKHFISHVASSKNLSRLTLLRFQLNPGDLQYLVEVCKQKQFSYLGYSSKYCSTELYKTLGLDAPFLQLLYSERENTQETKDFDFNSICGSLNLD
ncbi:uncharacterized protein [Amphiura filiformis]|uniref:uncharacterized protein n=1 Tax=Amphiura filiformis TaxID=82378 RepID=UPI003B2157BA